MKHPALICSHLCNQPRFYSGSWNRTCCRGTDNSECLKMAMGHQEFSTSFARTVNHAVEDELEEDLLQHVMETTME
jgi:hypothetical protein